MLAHGYSADAYCDNPECVEPYRHWGDQGAGSTFIECKRQLVAQGWYIGREIQLCPNCRKRGVMWAKRIIARKGKR